MRCYQAASFSLAHGGVMHTRNANARKSRASVHARRALVGVTILGATALFAEAHPHRGALPPYKGEPPKITLSSTELTTLQKGEAVLRQTEAGIGGRGLAVQDIAASPDVVWGRILDFDRYPQMIDNVKEIEVYDKGTDRIKVRFVIGQFGLHLEYFIDHIVEREKGFMTWTLDYDKKSELDDSVGYWYVEAHPTEKAHTRLYYSVDVRMSGWVPGFVQDLVRDEGLVRATRWVKLWSEKKVVDDQKAAAPTGATREGGTP